jgi:hypothetical protein
MLAMHSRGLRQYRTTGNFVACDVGIILDIQRRLLGSISARPCSSLAEENDKGKSLT